MQLMMIVSLQLLVGFLQADVPATESCPARPTDLHTQAGNRRQAMQGTGGEGGAAGERDAGVATLRAVKHRAEIEAGIRALAWSTRRWLDKLTRTVLTGQRRLGVSPHS